MPRSPSRDRSDRFTGFRGYVRVPDRLARAKSAALLSAGVLVGLWLVVEAAHPRAGAFHTHGELANPHAAWDQDCAACHRSQGLRDFSLSGVLNARDRWHDLTCTKCHAGPAHHAAVADTAFHDRCSNCHHDHAGRTASLTRLTDEHCVRCHQNLPAAHVAGAAGYQNVSAFAGGHPEFAALRDHPPGRNYEGRRLKFSHAVHMTPGLTDRWTLDRIAKLSGPAAAERYREFSTAEGVALTCAACHALDAQVPDKADPAAPDRPAFDRISELLRGQPRSSILPPRAEGAYYLPVNYDAGCKACHPITAPAAKSGAATIDGFPLPHRVSVEELRPLVRGGYTDRLAKATPALAKAPAPGGRLDPAPAPEVVATFGGEVDRLTNSALGLLMLGATPPGAPTAAPAPDQFRVSGGGYACGKCHYTTGPGPAAGIAPLPQHTVWFAHAKFNHVSHRGLTCASCHPGTGRPATPPAAVNEVEPLAILGAESCRACHAPAGTKVSQPDGTTTTAAGIRHGCTDCHRYHNGDRPLHGLGSPLRDPKEPQTLADFLRGGKAP